MNTVLKARATAHGTPLRACLAMGMLAAALMHTARAQTTAEPARQPADAVKPLPMRNAQDWERWQANSVDRVYKLKYTPSPQDANEVLTAMRNMLEPQTKIFLVPSTGTIAVHAPEEEQARIAKLLAALDQPHGRYRLTYTLTEMDGPKKIGVQHFSMVVVPGQRSQMKQGSRLPITVGGGPQFNYLDVGMNFDATLQEVQGGGVLKNRVEDTSVAPDSVTPSNPNPILRQTQLEGTALLTLNRPQQIGALDVPSSTHHFEIEVVMEMVN